MVTCAVRHWRRRSTGYAKLNTSLRSVAIDQLKVRRTLPDSRTSFLEWSGEDPEGREIGIVPKGANHAFQRRGETSKILASRGLCAGVLVAGHIGTGAGSRTSAGHLSAAASPALQPATPIPPASSTAAAATSH